jgi:hypothetical protein
MICTWDSMASTILFIFITSIRNIPNMNRDTATVPMEATDIQLLRLKE